MKNTLRTHLRTLLAVSALAAAGVFACQPGINESSPANRDGQIENAEALEVAIELGAELDKEQLEAVAKHIEQNAAGQVMGARVRVEKTDGAGDTLNVTLVGQNLGDGSGIADSVKAAFPALADANITVGAGQPPELPMAHSDADDPVVAEQEIVEQLQAQGVEGDIQVDVSDEGDGKRRVEVKVTQEQPE
ncbi:MAG: hypothetical protein R3A51_02300 [Nannocystaceae bacterium]